MNFGGAPNILKVSADCAAGSALLTVTSAVAEKVENGLKSLSDESKGGASIKGEFMFEEFMRVLVPNVGTLSGALEIARAKLENGNALRDIAVVIPVASKPWARQIARSQISAAANVLPSNYNAADERIILIELLAELDARRRGAWQE